MLSVNKNVECRLSSSSPSAFPSLALSLCCSSASHKIPPLLFLRAGAAAPSASPPVAQADARSRWRGPPWTSCPTMSWKTRSRTTMPMRHQHPSQSSREKALSSHLISTYHPQTREEIFRPSQLEWGPTTWPSHPHLDRTIVFSSHTAWRTPIILLTLP